MSILAIVGLILAVAVLIVGAYKGLGALPLTLLASLVVILTNGIPIWDGYATSYMKGYTGAYLSFFLLFASSSLYAELMNFSGCATTIGNKFIDWFGKAKVMLVSTLIISFLKILASFPAPAFSSWQDRAVACRICSLVAPLVSPRSEMRVFVA